MSFPSMKPATIEFPWSEPPGPGEMIEVADGVFWVRMPMPISLDHINLWLIADGDEWVVVDTGYGHDETCDLWRQLFTGAASSRKPGRLICTHHHPDHFGQAGWLEREYDIPVLMSEKEWLLGTLLVRLSDERFAEDQDRFYDRNGVPKELRHRLHAIGNEYRNRLGAPPDAFQRLRDGDTLSIGGRDWIVMMMEGHTEELTGLYCPSLRVFIPGDQVLPKITPNISVHWFMDGQEPLSDYLDSLDVIGEHLPEDTLVLPSHKLPFYGLHPRLADLQRHHQDRLAGLIDAMADGQARDAWQLLPTIFPRAIEDEHVMFALGESIAHLAHLVRLGKIDRLREGGKVLYKIRNAA